MEQTDRVKTRIAFDTKLRRPACVLLQAAFGCDWTQLSRWFPSKTWLVAPTSDMVIVMVTDEELEKLSAIAIAAVKKDAR